MTKCKCKGNRTVCEDSTAEDCGVKRRYGS
uniref:Uncharacterized protein n=1 Tax=Anguilla anguilla TaxID=7936 RepID=A0A0E9SG78_ANGAN